MNHLKQYTEQELFYQKYSLIKNDKLSLNHFLKQYSKSDLWEKRIYIEEILSNTHEEFVRESSVWAEQKKDIHIEKYDRFMPYLTAKHDFFEILYVVENTMDLEIESKKIALTPGDVCFISPATLHSPCITEQTIALQMVVRKSTFRKEFFRCLSGNSHLSNFFLSALYAKSNGSVLLFHLDDMETIRNLFFQIYLENYN